MQTFDHDHHMLYLPLSLSVVTLQAHIKLSNLAHFIEFLIVTL